MQASLIPPLPQAGKLEICLEYKQIYFYPRYVTKCSSLEVVKTSEKNVNDRISKQHQTEHM